MQWNSTIANIIYIIILSNCFRAPFPHTWSYFYRISTVSNKNWRRIFWSWFGSDWRKIYFKLPLWPHEAANLPETLWAFITCGLLSLLALVISNPTLWLPHWVKGENRSYKIFKHKLLLGFSLDSLQICYMDSLSKSMCFLCLSLGADLEFWSNFISSHHCECTK